MKKRGLLFGSHIHQQEEDSQSAFFPEKLPEFISYRLKIFFTVRIFINLVPA
jgi:hypothetical protein